MHAPTDSQPPSQMDLFLCLACFFLPYRLPEINGIQRATIAPYRDDRLGSRDSLLGIAPGLPASLFISLSINPIKIVPASSPPFLPPSVRLARVLS